MCPFTVISDKPLLSRICPEICRLYVKKLFTKELLKKSIAAQALEAQWCDTISTITHAHVLTSSCFFDIATAMQSFISLEFQWLQKFILGASCGSKEMLKKDSLGEDQPICLMTFCIEKRTNDFKQHLLVNFGNLRWQQRLFLFLICIWKVIVLFYLMFVFRLFYWGRTKRIAQS